MKFQKGQSGNPGGRPKLAKEVQELALGHCAEAFSVIVGLMQSSEERIRLAAAQEILNRAIGKPGQAIKLDSSDVRYVIRMPEPAASTQEWLERVRASGYPVKGDVALLRP